MRERLTLVILAAFSAAALGVAYMVQYGWGYAPCPLCTLARWPHVAAIAIGVVALWRGTPRTGLVLMALAMVAVFAISLQHVGVEAGWLPLPDSCRIATDAFDVDSLRQALMAQTQPGCDQPGPRFLDVSLAAWHGLTGIAAAIAATLAFTSAVTAPDRQR